MPFTTRRII